jgi:antitoxin VapB
VSELDIKTERLVKMMRHEGFGGILLNAQHNFAWLTGGSSNGVDQSRENGISSLLIRRDGKRFVIANCIEMPRMLAEQLSEIDFEPIEFSWETDKTDGVYVPQKAEGLIRKGTLATDVFWSSDFPVAEGAVSKCRYQLIEKEIERFRRLGADAGRVISGIYKSIVTGLTEIEIANIVRFELGKAGINPVVLLVAADERISAYRHPVPTENIWKKNLMIVVCAKRDGLIASLSRIFSVGKSDDYLRERTDAVASVHAQMMHATLPGAFAKEIFELTKHSYRECGFPDEELKHHQGGACGYKTRDWVAHSQSGEQVYLNQAFAWNPSIAGTKSEETFIVNENGIELITAVPGFPSISNVIDGKEYATPDILTL